MVKNWHWYFSIWRPRGHFVFGIDWCSDKTWFRGLQEFNIYLGFFAFGWMKMPEPVKSYRAGRFVAKNTKNAKKITER